MSMTMPPESYTAHTPSSRLAGARKYFKIFRVTLIERMTYRSDFFLATCLRFLPMLTTILLWGAIFKGSGEDRLAGFSKSEMIAYLLMVQISRMFSSMPGLAGGIAREIRDGSLKKYLLQPLDMVHYLLVYRIAHKITYITTTFLPHVLLFYLCLDFFDRFPDPLTFLAYLISLILAFLVGFYFEVCVGMIGFWFLEVTSLLYIVMTVNFFLSGHMFPIDLLPPFWVAVLKALPFQYLAYFPAVVFLGKAQGMELVMGLLGGAAWALVFILLSRWLYRGGLRRYSAFGG